MTTLIEKAWRRHSSPWSVWTRVLSFPLVFVPLWNRSWKQGAAVAAWFAINPVLFPEPEDDSSWATRGVLGEKLWTAERPRDLLMLLGTVSAVLGAGGLLFAYKRRFWPMMLCASAAFPLLLWRIDRYAVYYEQHRREAGGDRPETVPGSASSAGSTEEPGGG
jgi:hypothetical protein